MCAISMFTFLWVNLKPLKGRVLETSVRFAGYDIYMMSGTATSLANAKDSKNATIFFFCSLLNLILDFNVRKCVRAISNDTLKLNIETKTANSKMRYFAAVNKVTVVLSSFSLSWNVLITLFVAFIACCTSLWKFYRCNAHANRVSSCLKLVYFIPCMLLFLLSLHIVILSIRVHCANSCFGYSFPMFPYNIHSTSSICVSTLSYLHNLPPRLVSSLIFSLFSFFLSFRWFHFIATLAPSSCLPYVLSQINNIITRW